MITTLQLANVGLYSIATSRPIPDIIFHWKIDCSSFRDPIGQSHLKALDGRDERVQAFLLEDPRMKPILHAVRMIAAEKAKWSSICFFDHHGKYISTGIVELAAQDLSSAGYYVAKSHHALVPMVK